MVPASNVWTNTTTLTNWTDVLGRHPVVSIMNMKNVTNAMHPLPLIVEDASSGAVSTYKIMAAINASILTHWPSLKHARLPTVLAMIRTNAAVLAETDTRSRNNLFASCRINTVHLTTVPELNVFNAWKATMLTQTVDVNMLINTVPTSTGQASASTATGSTSSTLLESANLETLSVRSTLMDFVPYACLISSQRMASVCPTCLDVRVKKPTATVSSVIVGILSTKETV